MATPDSTLSTLAQIQTKVRRLTRSLSEAQLTTDQLNDYINTFVLYDFPEHLRLFNLQTTFTFFTEPYIDTYESNDTASSVFYNFKNKYLNIMPPIYIAGKQSLFLESREQFFAMYPMFNSIASIGQTGNAVATSFTGVINTQQAIIPSGLTQIVLLLRNNVLFSSVGANGANLAMIDYPISPTIGNLYIPGGAPTSTSVQDTTNYINYTTGAFVVTFTAGAPANGVAINSQTVSVQPTLPQSMLFYDGKFTMRPVPDQAYRIQMEVAKRPTELLAGTQSPELAEWWQYIAYGTSKKVFEDRMDLDSVQLIMPEFKKQEALINRRTIVQQTSQRTTTIYSNESGGVGSTASGAGFGRTF
jgi:hypothetical protein